MGLNEIFGQTCSQILMMNPLPNISISYIMIVADESQRMTAGSKIGEDVHESIILYVRKGGYYTRKGSEYMMSNNKGKGDSEGNVSHD